MKEKSQFAVIGLGRFGRCLAEKLFDMGKDVLIIDDNADKINAAQKYCTHSVVANAADQSVLESVGIKNFDVVAVCIGSDLESSIFITMLLKELGCKFIVAKAKNHRHETVLKKVGADMIVFPEDYMGKKIASILVNPTISDVTEISDDYKIVEMALPHSWEDKTLAQLELRKNYNVQIILVKNINGTDASLGGETILKSGDTIVIGGNSRNMDKLSQLLLKKN